MCYHKMACYTHEEERRQKKSPFKLVIIEEVSLHLYVVPVLRLCCSFFSILMRLLESCHIMTQKRKKTTYFPICCLEIVD